MPTNVLKIGKIALVFVVPPNLDLTKMPLLALRKKQLITMELLKVQFTVAGSMKSIDALFIVSMKLMICWILVIFNKLNAV